MIPYRFDDVPVMPLGFRGARIGPEPVAPAGEIVIAIEGAHLVVDPARPGDLPTCVVTDAEAAAPGVGVLYGDDTRAALRMMREDDAEPTSCAVDVGDELRQIVRLGVVRWTRLWSPLPFDDLLAQLEEDVLVGRLHALLEGEDDWALALERSCGLLLDRAGTDVLDGVVEPLVIDALDLLATALPVDDPVGIRAREQLARRTPEPQPAASPMLRLLGEPAWPLALVAGGSVLAGKATVDWQDVPRSSTSTAEGNVSWSLDLADDHADITVTVDGPEPVRRYAQPSAAPYRPTIERLAFDVYAPGWPFAVLTGELTFAEQSWTWTGSAHVGQAQADLLRDAMDDGGRLTVRVRSLEPAPAQRPTWALAHRWTCRGLAAARLAEIDPTQAELAGEAWRYAAGLWRMIGDDTRADECDRLARDLVAGLLDDDLTVAEIWLLSGD